MTAKKISVASLIIMFFLSLSVLNGSRDALYDGCQNLIKSAEAEEPGKLDCYQTYNDPGSGDDTTEMVCTDPDNNNCVLYRGSDFGNQKIKICPGTPPPPAN